MARIRPLVELHGGRPPTAQVAGSITTQSSRPTTAQRRGEHKAWVPRENPRAGHIAQEN